MKKYLFAIAAVALLFACKKEEKPAAITVGAEEITPTIVVLKGKATLGPVVSTDWKVGFQYSTASGIMPSNSTTVEAEDADVNYNYSATLLGLQPETTYYYRAFFRENGQDIYGETREFRTGSIPKGAVDLGIVMTREDGTTYPLFWAPSNLRKNGLCLRPVDKGDYYAWGETEPKSNFTLENEKWNTSGDQFKYTRYCPSDKPERWDGPGSPDNKTEFSDYDYVDDAARQTLGGNWRTPTSDELMALVKECKWTFTDNYEGTGVKGMFFEGRNGNHIFLPVTGEQFGTTPRYTEDQGYYWSSSLCTQFPGHAFRLYFGPTYAPSKFQTNRYCGAVIRPVTE